MAARPDAGNELVVGDAGDRLLARKLPVWASVLIVLILELVPLIVIRDNLFLNVWMLLAPNQAVLDWQSGA